MVIYLIASQLRKNNNYQKMSDYVAKCTANSDVCVTGLLFGVILTLLLVWIYLAFFSKKSERMFNYPNQPTPAVAQLIAVHGAADPQYSRLATDALNQQAANAAGTERFAFAKEGFNFAKGA